MQRHGAWFISQVFNVTSNAILQLTDKSSITIVTKNNEKKKLNKTFFIATPQTTCKSLNYNYNSTLENYLRIKKYQNSLYKQINWTFWKFKYNGKGLKIKKTKINKQILFNLGASHISKIWYNPNTISIIRSKKNAFTIFAPWAIITNLYPFFKKIRKYNKYTKRGLRLHRQPIIRRFGKVSQLGNKKR